MTKEAREYQLTLKCTCEKCGKEYGRTNLSYQGVEIWLACDCHPKDLIYCIDPGLLQFPTEKIIKGEE